MKTSSFQLMLKRKDEFTGVLLRARSAIKTFADQVQTGNEVLKQAASSIKGFTDALNSGITTFLKFKEEIGQINKGQAGEQDQRAKRRSEILTAAVPELQGSGMEAKLHLTEAKKERDEQLEEFKGELLTQLAIWNNYFKSLAKIKKEERDKEKKADLTGQKETQEGKFEETKKADQQIQKSQESVRDAFLSGWAKSWKDNITQLKRNAAIMNQLGQDMAEKLRTGFSGMLTN